MEMETHALVCILMVMLMVVMMFIVVVMTKRWDRDSNLSKRLHLLQQSGHDCDCAPAEGGFCLAKQFDLIEIGSQFSVQRYGAE